MALTLELMTGSDITLDRDGLRIVRKMRVRGTLPYIGGGIDAFDAVATQVMEAIVSTYATYGTPQGTLFWNSIQLHESFYGQMYEISVTYSPYNKATGTYLIRIEHSAGMAKATAGTRIAGYPADTCPDNKGVIWNGREVVGVDVPYNQTRVVVSYRHPEAFLDHDYLRAVGELTGHPNEDEFIGYDPGEVCYTGGNGTESQCECSVEYSFEISRNVTDFEVGGITIDEKKGFDILSPVYKWDVDEDESGTKRLIQPIDGIEIIRPVGRDWKNYQEVFGWGGS